MTNETKMRSIFTNTNDPPSYSTSIPTGLRAIKIRRVGASSIRDVVDLFQTPPETVFRILDLLPYCFSMMATSMGWTMARSAFQKAIVLVALLWPTIATLRLLKSYDHQVPKEIFTSAFDNDLYMAFQEPYRSYPCMPQKVHISQASNVKNDRLSMTVSFTLDREMCTHAKPTVVYGRGYLPEGEVTAAEKLDFDFRTNTGENYTSDWIYHMQLPDLVAGLERYWYRILIDQDEEADLLKSDLFVRFFFLRGMQGRLGQTPDYSFRTAPHLGSPTSLALVGDIGQTDNSTKTMHHIMNAVQARVPHPVSAVLIAGDLSYADGDPHRWERWLDLMEPLLRTTPLQTAAGNHEIECDNITRNIFGPYENFFRNPNRIAPADMLPVDDDYRKTLWRESCTAPSQFLGHYNFGNAFYAFSHGMVQVIVLNSYTDTKVGSVQYKWLERELQAVDRTITPWLLVMFHCPLHTTFLGHDDELNPTIMLENMEPLFVEHTVNIIVSGHDHAYMRTHSMVGGKLDLSGKGPKYFILGAGGNRELHSRGYVHGTPEVWVAKRDNDEYGYGHFFAANATHAHFTWVRDGTTTEGVQDNVWLINQLTSTE